MIPHNTFSVDRIEAIRSTFQELQSVSRTAERLGINYLTAQKYTADLRDKKERRNAYNIIKTQKALASPVTLDQASMQKGYVKLQKNEKVLPNRVHKPKKSVPMFDSKNTVLFVDMDDLRSPEEIRSEWKIKQELSLKNLAV